jgi:hypothetical protein
MRLIVLTVVVALVAGFLAGGSLREFPTVRTRWWGLALLGVAMQFVTGGAVEIAFLIGSFAVLLVFVIANLRAPGFALILIGLALNATVIALNQGMPVTRAALLRSGQADTMTELVNDGDGQKHFLADDGTVLLPLGDVIALGGPVRQVVSIGDIFVHLGVGWFIVVAMRRRDPVPSLEPETAEM